MRRNRQDKSRRGSRWAATLIVVVGARLTCLAQTTNIAITPAADAFVRSLAPGDNYGAAGALSVSGAAAVNGSGQQNGLFDSLIRFGMADLAASMNSVFGSNDWAVASAVLSATEVAAPNNAIFNRGVGAFEVRWIAADNWVEGIGKPNAPTTEGVVYQDLGSLLNPAVDISLGQFTNSGVSGAVSFPLPLASALVSNIVAGADVNLYLTAASATVGFTFNSRNYGATNDWPSLVLTIAAKPAALITSIQPAGTRQVAIRFLTASNWTYVVQGLDGLVAGSAAGWSNLYSVPPKPFDDQALYVEGITNGQRSYRLLLSQ